MEKWNIHLHNHQIHEVTYVPYVATLSSIERCFWKRQSSPTKDLLKSGHKPIVEYKSLINVLYLWLHTKKSNIEFDNRVIPKVTLSSPCLWAYLHPLSPLSGKVMKFYEISVWNAEISCTGRNSENICSTSGGTQGQGKTRWKFTIKIVGKN